MFPGGSGCYATDRTLHSSSRRKDDIMKCAFSYCAWSGDTATQKSRARRVPLSAAEPQPKAAVSHHRTRPATDDSSSAHPTNRYRQTRCVNILAKITRRSERVIRRREEMEPQMHTDSHGSFNETEIGFAVLICVHPCASVISTSLFTLLQSAPKIAGDAGV